MKRLSRKNVIIAFSIYPLAMGILIVIYGWFRSISNPDELSLAIRALKALEAVPFMYLLVYYCSPSIIWKAVFVFAVASIAICFSKPNTVTFTVANFGLFSLFCVPLILIAAGVVGWCGP